MPKKKTSKMSAWMSLYKWAVGAVVVMTVVAIGAMVWQYVSFQRSLWMYEEFESEETASAGQVDINLIDSPRGKDGGLAVCGSSDETKGSCVVQSLSTPTSGLSCQALSANGLAAGEAGKATCFMAAKAAGSWAVALQTVCQPGLLYNQKSITSDKLIDKTTGQMKPKSISIEGMHKCIPGLAGRLCPSRDKNGRVTGWSPCFTVPYKGACKFDAEEVVNIVSGGKLYKFCAPTSQPDVQGATGCYVGNVTKPTVKVCCAAGKIVRDNICVSP